jgi:predicted nucleic acid-binding protein
VKVLYDTSVLIAALLVQHANHAIALPSLERARLGEVQGYLDPQFGGALFGYDALAQTIERFA